MCAVIGTTPCPEVMDSSRKQTKKKAACVALSKLKQEGQLGELFPDGAVGFVTLFACFTPKLMKLGWAGYILEWSHQTVVRDVGLLVKCCVSNSSHSFQVIWTGQRQRNR